MNERELKVSGLGMFLEFLEIVEENKHVNQYI